MRRNTPGTIAKGFLAKKPDRGIGGAVPVQQPTPIGHIAQGEPDRHAEFAGHVDNRRSQATSKSRFFSTAAVLTKRLFIQLGTQINDVILLAEA